MSEEESVLTGMVDTDAKCVDATARMWIEHGGDALGLVMLWPAIKQRIQELTDEIE